MQISASLVKELRERTGAGMMDCKKALIETEGDMDKAADFLREKGLAAAAKKASRIAAEGLVGSFICPESGVGTMVEINCETDFVAKTDAFQALVKDIAQHVAKSNPQDLDALLASKLADGSTVTEMVNAKIATIGEKITIRRFVRYEATGHLIDCYIHMGGKIGVIVEMTGEINDALKGVIHDVALQIAAASPVAPEYIHRGEVATEHLEHEKVVLAAQAREEGKPEKIIEKMVLGRVEKFYKEVCLLEQPFVKDPDISVEQMIAAKAPGATVVRFDRFKMGEGLEKKVNDLAAEVAAQTGGIQ